MSEIYFDGKLVLSEKVTLLPPYASLGFEKNIPFSLLGKNTPSKIEVMYDGVVTTLPTQKSTVIIVSLAGILLAIFVFILLYFVKGLNNNKYEKLKKLFIILIAVNILIGLISYPAYSHDLFNYMFDAKIATFYQQNPYLYKALDFPTDPWLRFMHWTHRYYPYGPSFLLLS